VRPALRPDPWLATRGGYEHETINREAYVASICDERWCPVRSVTHFSVRPAASESVTKLARTRQAREWAELGLGDLGELHTLLPEIVADSSFRPAVRPRVAPHAPG